MAAGLTERWDEVRILFEGALDQPAGQREPWLEAQRADDAVRAEVAALLACHDRPHSLLDGGVARLGAGSGPDLPEHYQIGQYRIERLLGRGGMGAVYLAGRSDESFDRQVAIKIIGRSLDSADALRRFLAERQTLAGLDHPNIARLLDGGATPDRLPYFVMEYVAGEPIDRFCKTHALDLDARLTLFLRVAAAVQHAHEHLIVHRDLKPDNVLVRADGEPKLLDFGIAKTIAPDNAPLTTINARAMTPRYASPEQIRGAAIGTSSDLYSLGVLLYELLTGQLPHGGSTESGWQVAREITDDEPAAPSAAATKSEPERHWAHRLKGDLDAILLMALRKEPERRYRSVDQFADDVRHYLSGRPVIARPDTVGYRARKFVSRNRLATAAAALAVVALAAGAIAALWQASVARAEAQRAQAETTRALRVSGFLKTVIGLPDPSWNGAGAGGRADMTVLDLIKNAGDRIDREFAADPAMAGDLHQAIGNTYRARGFFNDALRHFQKGLELRRRVLPADDPLIAESLFHVGAGHLWLGQIDDAERYFEQAVSIERSLPFRDAGLLPDILLDLSSMPHYAADPARAEHVLSEALELYRRRLGSAHLTIALAKQRLADVQLRRGNVPAAKSLLAEALAIADAVSATPLDKASLQSTLASAFGAERNYPEAERLIRQVVAAQTAGFGPTHVITVGSQLQLSDILVAQGKVFEARGLTESVVHAMRLAHETDLPLYRAALAAESNLKHK